MLACPGPCGVDPLELRRLTRPANLGFIDPAMASAAITGGKSLVDAVSNFFGGLFGKDTDKANYDYMREQSWDAFANIVGAVQGLIDSGRLSQDVLLGYIQAVEEIMRQMVAYTNESRKVIESAWIDPRFHDFYDFMNQAARNWRAMLPTLPGSASQFVSGAVSSIAGMSGASLLMLGGLAFMLLRPRRRAS